MIRLTLAGYRATETPIEGSRPFATERLYDEWIGFVIQGIDEAAGFAVDVSANRFNGGPEAFDQFIDVERDPDADRLAAHAALEGLWLEWCRPGAPGGDDCAGCRGACVYWPRPCRKGLIDVDEDGGPR